MGKKKISGLEKLTAYMVQNDLSANQLAKRCRISIITLLRVLHGFPMRKRTAIRITSGTEGIVQYEDLTDLPIPSKYRRCKFLKK